MKNWFCHTLFFCELFSALLFFAIPAAAQTEIADSLTFGPVEVSATRVQTLSNEIPASITIIDQQEVQGLQQTLSLEESLRRVLGVFVNNRNNLSQGDRISIRGIGSRAQFGVRGIKVVQDGIPLTFADGTTQLNNLDLGSARRIELLRGPASTLYGNAAGGVIYITSETLDTQRLLFNPRVTLGSFGFKKAQAKLKGTSGKTTWLSSVAATDLTGYRTFSEARIYNTNNVVRHYINDSTRLTFLLNAMYAPYMFNPSNLSRQEALNDPRQARLIVQRQLAGKEVWQVQGGGSLQKKLHKGGSLNSTVYGIGRDLFNPIFGRVIDVMRYSAGTRNVYGKDFSLSPQSELRLLAGFDLEYQNDRRREYENLGITEERLRQLQVHERLSNVNRGELELSQREQVLNSGLFSTLTWKWRQLSLTGGLRHDYFTFRVSDRQDSAEGTDRVNFSQLSPSAGALYRWGRGVETFVNFSTAFQTPTANEFSNDPAGGGFNQELRPERVRSVEAGVRRSVGKLQAELTGFYFVVDDQLIPYQVSTQSDETFYRNAGQTANRGLELWLQYTPVKPLRFTFSYSYMQYTFTDYVVEASGNEFQLEGNEVPGVPNHSLFAGVLYRHRSGISAEVNVQRMGEYFNNDFNGPVPTVIGPEPPRDLAAFINPAYTLTDLRAGFEHKLIKWSVNFFGGINNVFDVSYFGSIVPNAAANRFFEPAPGRNWYVGVDLLIR